MSTEQLRRFNIARAIELAGGVKALSVALGVTHQATYLWVRKGYVPMPRAVEIEQRYGVPAMNLIDPQIAADTRALMALSA